VTKLLVLSDLHVEFGSLVVPKTDADVVVLAGDIHVRAQSARWSGRLAKRLGIPVVLIAGNHEYYGTLSPRSVTTFGANLAAIRAEAARSTGKLLFLECETAIIEGVRFVGCTLWTDFGVFGNPDQAIAYAATGMTDFFIIANRDGNSFTPSDARDEFLAARRFLEAELATPFAGPTVVVTHHLPSMKSVPAPLKRDLLTAAYASSLDELVARSGAALWIHGHSHWSCDYMLGATRVICNPRGYFGVNPNPKFDPKLVVEVGAA